MEGGDLPLEKTAAIENDEFPDQRKKKKRFNDDQINLLESMFKTDTKLEPKRKLQLARDLELQPRQVAIWFQNRRARWKSKHLEQQYKLLKHNYDNLNSQYHSLCDQQQTLRAQLQKLRDTLTETDDDRGVESKDGGMDNEESNGKLKLNPTSLSNGLENDRFNTQSDNEDSENKGYVAAQYEEPQLLNLCRHLDASSIPTDKWCNFDHTSTNWLDFLA